MQTNIILIVFYCLRLILLREIKIKNINQNKNNAKLFKRKKKSFDEDFFIMRGVRIRGYFSIGRISRIFKL